METSKLWRLAPNATAVKLVLLALAISVLSLIITAIAYKAMVTDGLDIYISILANTSTAVACGFICALNGYRHLLFDDGKDKRKMFRLNYLLATVVTVTLALAVWPNTVTTEQSVYMLISFVSMTLLTILAFLTFALLIKNSDLKELWYNARTNNAKRELSAVYSKYFDVVGKTTDAEHREYQDAMACSQYHTVEAITVHFRKLLKIEEGHPRPRSSVAK